ncbi:MAG: hypothetical protein ACREDJ_04520, partial [Methylocella sp.]
MRRFRSPPSGFEGSCPANKAIDTQAGDLGRPIAFAHAQSEKSYLAPRNSRHRQAHGLGNRRKPCLTPACS